MRAHFGWLAASVPLVAVVLGGSASVGAQPPAKAETSRPWTVPRTPDGRPDLQGIWTNATLTPLERPRVMGDRAFLTENEAAALEAQVMRDGMLVGFVPVIDGSEDFDDDQVIDAIVRTDYDKPVATQRRQAPPPTAPLPREGGVFRRFLGGFRHD